MTEIEIYSCPCKKCKNSTTIKTNCKTKECHFFNKYIVDEDNETETDKQIKLISKINKTERNKKNHWWKNKKHK